MWRCMSAIGSRCASVVHRQPSHPYMPVALVEESTVLANAAPKLWAAGEGSSHDSGPGGGLMGNAWSTAERCEEKALQSLSQWKKPSTSPTPTQRQLRLGIARSQNSCGCLGVCVTLFSFQFIFACIWLLAVSPETLRYVPDLEEGVADCRQSVRESWSKGSHIPQEWCCNKYGVGCRPGHVNLGWFVGLEALVFAVTVVLPLLAFSAGRLVERRAKSSIRALQRDLLGVDIQLDNFWVEVCCGKVHVEGLVIGNLDGYQAPYLLSAGGAHLDLNMSKLFCSCCSDVHVQKLVLQGVDVINEVKGSSSNVKDFLHSLHLGHETKVSSKTRIQKLEEFPDKAQAMMNRAKATLHVMEKITLQEVSITDIGCRVQLDALAGLGARVSVVDQHWENFTEEVGAHVIDDVARVLLGSLLKSALTNVIGKGLADMIL